MIDCRPIHSLRVSAHSVPSHSMPGGVEARLKCPPCVKAVRDNVYESHQRMCNLLARNDKEL